MRLKNNPKMQKMLMDLLTDKWQFAIDIHHQLTRTQKRVPSTQQIAEWYKRFPDLVEREHRWGDSGRSPKGYVYRRVQNVQS